MKKTIFLFLILIGAFYVGINLTNGNEPSKDSSMKDLDSMELLKTDFNNNEGEVRIVTLLSPT